MGVSVRIGQNQPAESGAALVLLIPLILVFMAMGFLFLGMVQSGARTQVNAGLAAQNRYAALSGLQASFREIQPRTYLAQPVRAGMDRIMLEDASALPSRGELLIGGAVPEGPAVFRKTAGNEVQLDVPVQAKIPAGRVIYLCEDLDGNGVAGTVTAMRINGSVVTTRFDEPHESPTRFPRNVSTVYLQAIAERGELVTVLDAAQQFDE